MKGYRTIAFNLIMGFGLVLGHKFDPEMVNQALVGVIAAWTGGNVILRWVTTTGIFRKE